MREMKNQSVQYKVLRSVAFIVAVYTFCAIFDSFFFDYRPCVLPLRQLYGCLLTAGFLYVCVRLKYAGLLLYLLFTILASGLFYAYEVFGYTAGFEAVNAALGTNWYELSGFLDCRLFAALIAYIVAIPLIYAAVVFALGWKRLSLKNFRRVALVVLLWWGLYMIPSYTIGVRHGLYVKLSDETLRGDQELMFGAGMVNARISYNRWRMPYANFVTLYEGIKEYARDISLIEADEYGSRDIRPGEDVTLLLVLGESIRGDHVPAGGYVRNTMPKCSARPDVTFFTRMYSYGPFTSASIQGMLSGLVNDTDESVKTSFASILRNHGFRNTWYFENTGDITSSRFFYSAYGKHMHSRKVCRMPVEKVADTILSDVLHQGGRQLVIIENGTGHYPYVCEEKYRTFFPCGKDMFAPPQGDTREYVVNDYDNCIIALDSFFDKLMNGLHNRNAVLLYVSDHGQFLGEGGRYMHGGEPENELLRHVAAFIWFSDEYERRHPELVAEMKSVKDKLLVHGQIYATVLKLCGIESEVPLDIGCFVDGDVREVEHNLPKSLNVPSRKGVK